MENVSADVGTLIVLLSALVVLFVWGTLIAKYKLDDVSGKLDNMSSKLYDISSTLNDISRKLDK